MLPTFTTFAPLPVFTVVAPPAPRTSTVSEPLPLFRTVAVPALVEPIVKVLPPEPRLMFNTLTPP